MENQTQINKLVADWTSNPRWEGIERPYTAEEVVNLRGSIQIEHTLAKIGAKKFWDMLMEEKQFVPLVHLLATRQYRKWKQA